MPRNKAATPPIEQAAPAPAIVEEPNLAQAIEDLTAIRQELEGLMVEREREIGAVLMTVLARQHAFLLGEPGVGKTTLITNVARRLGLSSFTKLIFREMGVGEIFGPYSLKGWEQDEERRTLRYGATSNVWILDEIWKGSPALLNSILSALEERVFDNNGERVELPLVSCFGASNEPPQDTSLRALRDRFAVAMTVKPLSPKGRVELTKRQIGWRKNGGKPEPEVVLTEDTLQVLWDAVAEVAVPDQIINTLHNRVIPRLATEGIGVSDRRSTGSGIALMQAHALLHGRTEVTLDDFAALGFALWDEPKDEAKAHFIMGSLTDTSERLSTLLQNFITTYQMGMAQWATSLEEAKPGIIATITKDLRVMADTITKETEKAQQEGKDIKTFMTTEVIVDMFDGNKTTGKPPVILAALQKDARDRF